MSQRLFFCFQILISAMCSLSTYAQSALNIRAELNGTHVIITYDLPRQERAEDFTVEVFASHNNFQKPLRAVRGDVGPGVIPGLSKKVVWNAKEELGDFVGELIFEISATPRLASKPLVLISPGAATKLRHGKTVNIQWQGGNPLANVSLQWRQGTKVIKEVNNLPNTRSYQFQLDKSMKRGTYQLVLQQGEEESNIDNVVIKPKSRWGIKLAPLALAGLAVVIFDPFGWKKDNSGLPVPPDPN